MWTRSEIFQFREKQRLKSNSFPFFFFFTKILIFLPMYCTKINKEGPIRIHIWNFTCDRIFSHWLIRLNMNAANGTGGREGTMAPPSSVFMRCNKASACHRTIWTNYCHSLNFAISVLIRSDITFPEYSLHREALRCQIFVPIISKCRIPIVIRTNENERLCDIFHRWIEKVINWK